MSETPHQPLVLLRDAGGLVVVQLPIPPIAVLSLPALAAATLREWVVVDDDGNGVHVCGHGFTAVGWLCDENMPGVVLRHLCCEQR